MRREEEISRFQRLFARASVDKSELNSSAVSKLFYLFALFAMRAKILWKFIGVDRSQTLVRWGKKTLQEEARCETGSAFLSLFISQPNAFRFNFSPHHRSPDVRREYACFIISFSYETAIKLEERKAHYDWENEKIKTSAICKRKEIEATVKRFSRNPNQIKIFLSFSTRRLCCWKVI